jgi:hypothetical protein
MAHRSLHDNFQRKSYTNLGGSFMFIELDFIELFYHRSKYLQIPFPMVTICPKVFIQNELFDHETTYRVNAYNEKLLTDLE